MKFSIIFPTRGRPKELHRTLTSIKDRTHDMDNVEVIVGIDKDDKDLEMFSFKGVNLKRYHFNRQGSFGSYYNALARHATGDVLWVWSDEALLCTHRWDRVAEKKIEKTKWNVWLGATHDFVVKEGRTLSSAHPLTKERFSCFPMISREAYLALGWVHMPALRCWGSDLYLNMLFRQMNRVVDLDRIEVNHVWSEGTGRLEIYKEDIKKLIDEGKAENRGDDIVGFDISEDMKKLRMAMGEPLKCPVPTLKERKGGKHWWDFMLHKV